MVCRLNCTCKICGRVRLHVSKTVRKSSKPRGDAGALELQMAITQMARPTAGAVDESQPGQPLAGSSAATSSEP